MLQVAKQMVHKLVRRSGYEIYPVAQPDFDQTTIELIRRVHPLTMTSPERIFAFRESIEYVVRNEVPGGILECGVWKGGSMLAAALTLMELGDQSRDLYLFDTFTGMSAPTDADVNYLGERADKLLAVESELSWNWAKGPLEGVRKVMESSAYDPRRIHYVQGKVEDTLPEQAPAVLSILRLDTDWYESTYHELVHLYPRLSPGGVLIIDDYGHWQGSRRAVDQYFAENGIRMLLNRIDYSGRIGVKAA